MPMFFTTEQINPSLTLLSDNYAKIRDEFKNVRDELEYKNWNGNNEYTSIKKSPYDGWKVAPLYAMGIGILLTIVAYAAGVTLAKSFGTVSEATSAYLPSYS